ncbi:MAG: alanine--tRNA ligase [Vallitaleaceae bacterium]|jgi:alanyl-tRNA synthetase|nr:alanine--tRNA ligase [Vallitaleaceae bacterium]
MQHYGLNELRKMYLDFFESKGHLVMGSFPLVPKNDKSLLLINAGMAPLKPYFTGQEVPPKERLVTCQKCIRTGDIENVGKTDRHGTFFEMLGNFSFGDYFKKDAILWAWEFFIDVLKVPKELLYASVYEEDDDAFGLWKELTDIDPTHVVKMGKADNFWEHGSGPCGPCSEIYYDRGAKYGCDDPSCTVGCECDRYVEVWNLVFTQFEKTDDGRYLDLPNPNIDTGMGLERLAIMMQDAESFFTIDTLKKVLDKVCQLADKVYKGDKHTDISLRLITDHIRSVVFMTSDGILPSNEGRGYVLRRLLRRAARHGRLIGIKGLFLETLAKEVIETSYDAYPELKAKESYILKILSVEEERFNETIDQGLTILNTYIEELEADGKKELSGERAFKLYDTYGFPLDLTLEIMEEKGLLVDEAGFKSEMQAHRVRARDAREETNYMGANVTVYNQLNPEMITEFDGYDKLLGVGKVLTLTSADAIVESAGEGDSIGIFVDKTPFYATSGGQHNDYGIMTSNNAEIEILDVKKVMGNKIAHIGKVISGSVKVGDTVKLIVDAKNRYQIAKNHSTTHLLQKALKRIVGDHIEQAGSSVNADRLRFDFTHFQALTAAELKAVEDEVNHMIELGLPVVTENMAIDEAKKKGAMALFGEKYGDSVRVVSMGDYSMELCGGTHISNTSEAGLIKIISEQGVAAGVRRIEALTSDAAINYYKEQEALVSDIAGLIKVDKQAVIQKIENMLADIKSLQSENEKLKSKLATGAVDDLINQIEKIGPVEILVTRVPDTDMNGLREMGDQFKQKLTNGIVVLITASEGKVNLLAMVSDEAIKLGAHAGHIIKEVASVVGGGGGGRPNMAQAGGKLPEKINDALAKAKEVIQSQL